MKLTVNQKIKTVGVIVSIISVLATILISVFKNKDVIQESTYNISSNNQSGGITAGVLNIGEMPPPSRQLSDELKKSLRETGRISKPKCIYVENKLSKESLQFASEINNFLKGEGIKSILYSGTMFILSTDIRPSKERVIIQDDSHVNSSDDCAYIFVLAQPE